MNASTPAVVGDAVLFSAAYSTGAAMLELTEGGGFRERWSNPDILVHFAPILVLDGVAYCFSGENSLTQALIAVDLENGSMLWSHREEWEEEVVDRDRETTRRFALRNGSLLAVDGRVLALGEDGHLFWMELDASGCRVTDRHWLFRARESWVPPVVSHGLLYVLQCTPGGFGQRSGRRLLCYDLSRS